MKAKRFLGIILSLSLFPFTSTVLAGSPGSCDPAPTGIVAWWPGEGNPDDLIGADNGTANGNLTYTNGEVGQAFVFDGSSYITVPASPSLNIGAGSGLTIECWVNPSALNATGVGGPMIEWDSDSDDGAQFWANGDGSLYSNIKDTFDNGHTIQTAPGVVPTNVWTHVALIYDESSGNVFIYTNGNVATSAPLGTFTPQTTYPVNIGIRTGQAIGDEDTFAGMIDELSLYNRALSPNEITAIYHAGSAGKCQSVPPFITQQPPGNTVIAGSSVGFSVVANGALPLNYRWTLNDTTLPGATNATLTLTNVQVDQAGNYAVTVSNVYGSTNSTNATLVVDPLGTCDPPPSGIVSWWPGEDNADDIIGTNNGVLQGSISFGPGEVGQAFLFNTLTDAVMIPASDNLNVGAGSGFTLEAWINPSDVSQLHTIFEWYNVETTFGVQYYISEDSGPGSFYANIVDDGGNWHQMASPVAPVVTNVFQHVALTYDQASGIATMYYNGAIIAQANLGNFTPRTTADLYLGNEPGAFGYAGLIDAPAIYNRALSSNEIAAIYFVGSGGKCLSTAPYITQQPTNQTVSAAANATFQVIVGSSIPLGYQWYFNDTNLLSGATNSTLLLTNVQSANQGDYSVVISGPSGSLISSNATLTVTVDHFAWNLIPSPRFLNTPFAVKVTAEDAANAVFTNYTGIIFLGTTNGVPVAPAIVGDQVRGVWIGTVVVSQLADGLVLSAGDGSGHIGLSNPINIVPLPMLATTPFEGVLYLSWPTNPAGFHLEKTTSLEYGPWLPVNGTPPVFGGVFVEPITPVPTNSRVFYRLYFNGP